jgi:hypothetical protein
MTAFLISIALNMASSHADVAKTVNESLEALRREFGTQIEVRSGAVPRIRYCPDNTCDSFVAVRGASQKDLADFALLYVWGVSQYTDLERWQKGNAPLAVERALARQRARPASVGPERLKCAIRTLAKRAAIRVSFVRYDEGAENVVKVDLEEELNRPKRQP